MHKFELGIAFRGSSAPEVRQVVEAHSMREAMLNVVDQFGGNEVALITHAHYWQEADPVLPCSLNGGAESFMLAPNATT